MRCVCWTKEKKTKECWDSDCTLSNSPVIIHSDLRAANVFQSCELCVLIKWTEYFPSVFLTCSSSRGGGSKENRSAAVQRVKEVVGLKPSSEVSWRLSPPFLPPFLKQSLITERVPLLACPVKLEKRERKREAQPLGQLSIKKKNSQRLEKLWEQRDFEVSNKNMNNRTGTISIIHNHVVGGSSGGGETKMMKMAHLNLQDLKSLPQTLKERGWG